ncbi:DUF4391 domain-containing protein [Bombilactobacillus folatiphilus]|uniref:DUF4391 domain-containing protein n=1 Tax=Bombilactobacillus folatiphilus TaxID=2923362 RepID=A0ABY4P882_9LACO|nr:DUF4391 domain-containing protein [Bombilactobacillus folatiphilus]UQS81817.1 DUF4391 domain-containing protein [Bombilactobacillus folatiphilus]
METKDIIKWWDLPQATVINRNFPKVKITPQLKKAKDKQFLVDMVQSIYMLADFKTDNTNIPSYESNEELYQELWFFYVKSKYDNEGEAIYRLLASVVPYPIVVLLEQDQVFVIYLGRFEKLAKGYLKLLSVYESPCYQLEKAEQVLNSLSLADLPQQNMKVLYDSLRDKIVNQYVKVDYHADINVMTGYNSELLDQVRILEKQITALRNKIKRETQLNRKVEMQMELKKLKDQLNELIENKS